MTETTNLSYAEIKEILAIFFDIPTGKIKCWNMNWQFETSSDYIKSKIEQHQRERDAEHKADYSSAL